MSAGRKITHLHLLAHILALAPAAWLAAAAASGSLTINPIQAAQQHSGRFALVLLLASLAVTPLKTLTGYTQMSRLRKLWGLYAFGYAALHLFIFLVIDYGLSFPLLQADLPNKRYIFIGLAAFLILAALAFTSFKVWKKRLGKGWKRLHSLVYLAAVLVIIHFSLAVKGNVSQLQGDVARPVIFGVVLALLLLARVPPIRRALARFRDRHFVYTRQRHGARQPLVKD